MKKATFLKIGLGLTVFTGGFLCLKAFDKFKGGRSEPKVEANEVANEANTAQDEALAERERIKEMRREAGRKGGQASALARKKVLESTENDS